VGATPHPTWPLPGASRRRLVDTAGLPLEPDRMLEYALIWASSHNRSEVVTFLLGKEPDLTFREPLFDSTALGVARYMGNRELVALLEPLTPGPIPMRPRPIARSERA
jgi:hypothetical protein